MSISSTAIRTRRRRKVMAIASAGTAVGLAAVVTLASWTDQEWVFGGTGPGDEDGVGTSSFNVQQDAWDAAAPTTTSTSFNDKEANPGNPLIFNVDPTGMTPGDTIYAPVALTTTAASIAGGLTLKAPVAATGKTAVDASGLLWNNLTYSVTATDDAAVAAECRTDFAASGTEIVSDLALTNPLAAQPERDLDAARGNVQYYCFAITLPDNSTTQDLQGRTVFPAWQFAAVSS